MTLKQGQRVTYKLTHPLYHSEDTFDSWLVLCETTVDIAMQEAQRQLQPQLEALFEKISDEMIATAEEYNGDNES